MASNLKKLFLINTGLLLGVAALFFRAYLPLTDEIAAQNEQLKSFDSQINTLKADIGDPTAGAKQKIYALPESDEQHLSGELEALAQKHQMKLIHVEPDKDQAESLSRYKLTVEPYQLAFSGKSPQDFAALLSELETSFPEISIKSFQYEKEVGAIDAEVLISSQNVRLFSP